MDIKKEYEKLSDTQRRMIDENVQDAINGIDGMRGDNDGDGSPIHAWLNSVYSDLCDLQDAGWYAFGARDSN
jgi:hypothetical protein